MHRKSIHGGDSNFLAPSSIDKDLDKCSDFIVMAKIRAVVLFISKLYKRTKGSRLHLFLGTRTGYGESSSFWLLFSCLEV